ncbi:barstar family protein [Candidatus Nitrospira bockiana]
MTMLEHLRSIEPPYVELLVLDQGQSHEALLPSLPGYAVRTFHGKKCRTKSGLLGEFARVLEFPSYFGKNWDALEDCLTDLQWVPAAGYVFIVTDADQVLAEHEDDYRTFLAILEAAGKMWATEQDVRPEIPFHVLFVVDRRGKAKRERWGIPIVKASVRPAGAPSPTKPAQSGRPATRRARPSRSS